MSSCSVHKIRAVVQSTLLSAGTCVVAFDSTGLSHGRAALHAPSAAIRADGMAVQALIVEAAKAPLAGVHVAVHARLASCLLAVHVVSTSQAY